MIQYDNNEFFDDIVNLLKRIAFTNLIRYEVKELSLIICTIAQTVDFSNPDDNKLIERIENVLGIKYAPEGKEDTLKAIRNFRNKLPIGSTIDFFRPDGKKDICIILSNYNDSSEGVISVNDIMSELNK